MQQLASFWGIAPQLTNKRYWPGGTVKDSAEQLGFQTFWSTASQPRHRKVAESSPGDLQIATTLTNSLRVLAAPIEFSGSPRLTLQAYNGIWFRKEKGCRPEVRQRDWLKKSSLDPEAPWSGNMPWRWPSSLWNCGSNRNSFGRSIGIIQHLYTTLRHAVKWRQASILFETAFQRVSQTALRFSVSKNWPLPNPQASK